MGPLTVLLAGSLLAAFPASGQLSALPTAAPRDSLREDFHRRLMLAIDPGDTQRVSLRDLRRRLQEELDLVRLQIEEGRITPQGGRVRYRQAIDAYRAGRDTVLTGTSWPSSTGPAATSGTGCSIPEGGSRRGWRRPSTCRCGSGASGWT